MQQNTHALRIQEHYLTWEDAINSVDLGLSLQKRVEKMRSYFPTMHTSTPEILPSSGAIHSLYQNLLKQKTITPVHCRQSTQNTNNCVKYSGNVGYPNTLKDIIRTRKQESLRWGLCQNRYSVSLHTGNQCPFMPKATRDSCSESDINASTFDQKKCNQKAGNPFSSLLECFSDSLGLCNKKLQVDDFGQELMVLAIPAIIGQAIEPMGQLMETAYVGRLGPVELAAVGVSISIFNLISKLFNIPLLNVTTSFVAEDASKTVRSEDYIDIKSSIHGDHIHVDKEEFQKHLSDGLERKQLPAVSTALVLAAGLGFVEAFALAFGAGPFLYFMGIPAASPMRLPSERYLALRALGAPAVVVSLAVQGVFRGLKDTKTPLYASGAGNILNALLFPICIFTLRFGVSGAAIATVASQYFISFVLLWNLNKVVILLPPKLKELRFDRYLKSGGLLLGRTVAVGVTMTLGTSMAARQGPIFMAGHQICLQVWLAVSLLTDALALAGQSLIASAFTKGDYIKVKKVAFNVLQIGAGSGIALAVILFTGFGSFAKLFTKDAAVLEVVRYGVLFVAGTQPINALAFVFDGLHYGISDFAYAAYSMMIVGTISSAFLVFAPSLLGIGGVWLGLALFMGLRMAAGFWRLRDKNGPWWFLRKDLKEMEVGY